MIIFKDTEHRRINETISLQENGIIYKVNAWCYNPKRMEFSYFWSYEFFTIDKARDKFLTLIQLGFPNVQVKSKLYIRDDEGFSCTESRIIALFSLSKLEKFVGFLNSNYCLKIIPK